MFSLIYAWINGWVNNGKAGDLRRHRAYYDVIVMMLHCCQTGAPHNIQGARFIVVCCGFVPVDFTLMVALLAPAQLPKYQWNKSEKYG